METKKDPKIAQIQNMLNHQIAIRQKSDKRRWEAFAYLCNRTKEQSSTADCPVPDKDLFDSAGVEAFTTFINGFMGAFMSPAQKWFKSRLRYKKYTRKAELEENYGYQYTEYLDNSIKDEMDHSNHYEEQKMASMDTIAGGYSCMIVQNDPDTDRCFYQTLLPWRCYFDHDLHGNWCEFYYKYTLDGIQLLEKYGDLASSSPQLFERAKKGGRNANFEMLMCIIKRGYGRDLEGRPFVFAKNKRYAEYDICLSENVILYEGGYDDFPVIIHVWEKAGDSQYGSGIGMTYLAELKKLNRCGYEYSLSIAKINHAPWLVPDTMKNKFSDDPEARVYYQTKELLPIPMQEKLDIGDQSVALDRQEMVVRKLFHEEFFNYFLSTDKVYTATQVQQVKSDSIAPLASSYMNIQRQKFDPTIKLTMKIMIDNGRLEIDPQYIGKKAETKLEFVLDSAMAQMLQTYTQVNAVSALIEMATTLVGMKMTDPLKNYNWDNIIRSYMFSSGAPASFIKPVEDVKREREQEAEMMQKQMQMQNALTNSEINRNNAGAANLNNAQGFNGGMQ